MTGIRSVTLATKSLNQTIQLFHHTLGLNYKKREGTVQFGDAELSPGTRIQFVEVPGGLQSQYRHFASIGLRIPSDEGLENYASILEENDISFSKLEQLNGHTHFHFYDDMNQKFSIFSNEHNTGIGLGMPYEHSSVNPLHQIQGLGPIIIKTNEIRVTFTLLTKVFDFTPLGEYMIDDNNTKVIVLHKDEGGLGSEIHLFEPSSPVQLPNIGIVEQIEFTTKDATQFENALKQLERNELPYQELENKQENTHALRITDTSGMSFILTLDQ
ncbi:VOC family protein [Staphylococcus ratti]|uniref:VOC family protein n=1 Tax=Staphylococcus ratti TaxID=2892440 RepID=A0ABY3PA55_9STAP|nr:VOC family protein [Staphylococcus ratti]UEX89192.1 VOC family protein [Staphylococcus ratti]